MLWLGVLARDTGIPASRHLEIKDEVTALDFNLAVSLRLLTYDRKNESDNRAFWVKLITGEDMDTGDDVLSATNISDPYADANTEVW